MKRHPSFGPVPPEEFHKAENAGVPACHQIIQKFVPSFGKEGKADHRRQIARERKAS